MTRLAPLRWACVAVLLAATLSAGAEEIVTVSGRKEETQSFLLMHSAAPPKAVAVMFPGDEGLLRLHNEGGSAMKDWMLGRPFPKTVN